MKSSAHPAPNQDEPVTRMEYPVLQPFLQLLYLGVAFVMMPLILIIASFPSTVMAQAGTFTATGNMTVAREFASATLLANGQVLIAGSGTADIYEPQTGTFTAIGNHGSHIATLLGDGRVLFIVTDYASQNRAEIFDPVSRTFTTSGTSVTGQIGGYAKLLTNGQVLVAGGFTDYSPRRTTWSMPTLSSTIQ